MKKLLLALALVVMFGGGYALGHYTYSTGDLNHDGKVNMQDFSILMYHYKK